MTTKNTTSNGENIQRRDVLGEETNGHMSLRARFSQAKAKLGTAAMCAAAATAAFPVAAFAEDGKQNAQMLDTILGLGVRAVALFGGGLIVWGGVKFGLAIKDQQGGNAIAEALATIGGGAIIIAAGGWFSTLTF